MSCLEKKDSLISDEVLHKGVLAQDEKGLLYIEMNGQRHEILPNALMIMEGMVKRGRDHIGKIFLVKITEGQEGLLVYDIVAPAN